MPAAIPTVRKPKENNWRAYKSGVQTASPINITRLENVMSAKLQAYRARRFSNRWNCSFFNFDNLSIPLIAVPPDRSLHVVREMSDMQA